MFGKLSEKLQKAWYSGHRFLWVLLPLSWLFEVLAVYRRDAYLEGKKEIVTPPCPVIIVGNINVGGSGKSPLVIWLVNKLKNAGYSPGVISRGYGGKAPHYPYSVDVTSHPKHVGDEPWMIWHRTGVPCVVDPVRPRGVEYLVEIEGCNVVVSDDGLQHYALGRDIEIAVVDGARGLGNERCLPYGPLREPVSRLQSVDFVVINGRATNTDISGYSMLLEPSEFYKVSDVALPVKAVMKLSVEERVHAIAGIGHPQRFFDTLSGLGYVFEPHAFPDHYPFTQGDLCFEDEQKILMTEKDAVKCFPFADENTYYLTVDAVVDDTLWLAVQEKLIAETNQ
ncbi:MAG: tetraacyldisaccharide 4'-kinase [Gammaproteobacteria bacterium]|nr:tetraacyldisaccharide 4'-kinase [Gammaproteobacteria bacterium]